METKSQIYHKQESDNQNQITSIIDNTLGSLTKKFVQLIKSAPNQKIQIQEASQILQIQKRRIYDITNVLEGIGYIEKLGKNVMKWVGGIEGTQLQDEIFRLDQQIEVLLEQTKSIQQSIDHIKTSLLNQTNQNEQFNYLTSQDMNVIMKAFSISHILIYSEGKGDHIEMDSNPQTNISQCIIESSLQVGKLEFINLPPQQNRISRQDNSLRQQNQIIIKKCQLMDQKEQYQDHLLTCKQVQQNNDSKSKKIEESIECLQGQSE